jgi:hypothetical protein
MSVEGEHARCHLRIGDTAVDAGQGLGKKGGFAIHNCDFDDTFRVVKGYLQGVRQAALNAFLDDQPVNDDVDIVFFLLVEGDFFGQIMGLAIDNDPNETILAQLGQLLPILPLAAANHGGKEVELGPLRQGHYLVDHLGHSLEVISLPQL